MTLLGKSSSLGRLLRRSALRYALGHPWQLALSFIGIMLGVMMVVAVDLANTSARRAFAISIESITGTISHQIVGGSNGLADEVYTQFKTQLGIRSSAPNLSGEVNVRGRSYTLLGLDAISEVALQRQRPGLSLQNNALGGGFFAALERSNSIVISQATALALEVSTGDTIALNSGRDTFQAYIAAVFQSENSVATEGLIFADIAVAQILLKRIGSIDSIDLTLNSIELERVEVWLPDGLALVEAQTRNDSLQQMTEAFHVNLLAMSMLSLLVAGLLIYNTVTLSVIQRQKTLGIFRSQGLSRQQIFQLVLGEAALLGLIASVAGLVLGFGLGRLLVQLVSRTINDLYFNLNVTSFLIDPWSLLKGLLMGLGITLISAALPAWNATNCAPVTLQQRAQTDSQWQRRLPGLAFAGCAMMLIGFVMLLPEHGSLIAGFVALTLIVFGFCFLVPGIMSLVLQMILKVFSPLLGITSKMALRSIQSGISRTGLAVAALTVAISVTVGVGIMVGSFRDTVVLWLEQSLGGDIQISSQANNTQNLPIEFMQIRERISLLDGVSQVNGTILKRIETELGQVRITSSDLPAQESYYIKEAGEVGLEKFNQGEGVLISEPLAYLHQLNINDTIRVYTDRGQQTFPIVGVFYDYTSSLGMLGFHQNLYEQWWNETSFSRLTITTSDEVTDLNSNLMPAVREILSTATEGSYFAISNRDLRQITLDIFDRTFAITNVLRLLALLVAFVGVLSALMALQLERLREYALLRATGMTPGQIHVQVFAQTALMGLFAGLLSLPLGLIMSDVLIDVINQRSFGWSMQHILPESVLFEALVLAVGAALMAGVYPAFKAANISPAIAMREE